MGIRPPNEWERARASGVGSYYARLGLAGKELYDAVGTHFGPRSLQQRLIPLLRQWGAGSTITEVGLPDPSQLLAIFHRLHAKVRQQCTCRFANLVSSPFRYDVVAHLVAQGLLPASTP